jgi:hypothetical protein
VVDQKVLVIGGEGNGQAYDTVEALDPSTGTWKTLASLNYARHGTQAIVSGGGVYVTAGSPNQGGGNQKNMEVYDTDSATGAANVAGVPSAPGMAWVLAGTPESILLDHVGGNEGLYISAISISGVDAADFALTSPITDPFLLPIAGSRELFVDYLGTLEGASASLDVTYGGSQVFSVDLTGVPVPEPGLLAGLGAGTALLSLLHRRRERRRRA